jgi:hypothetical protein
MRPITASEIESVIAKLQNNKAAGVDNITNEYIKFTLHIMLPIYTTIFNLVFDKNFGSFFDASLISLAILF